MTDKPLPSEYLQNLIKMQPPIPCVANLMAVCKKAQFQCVHECGLSVRGFCSNLTHQELDILVRSVRPKLPYIGHSVMRGKLRAVGCWVRCGRFQHPGEYILSRVPLCWSTQIQTLNLSYICMCM